MKRKLLFSLLISFCAIASVFAQERTVSGTVKSNDDGQLIPGVNVILKGTSTRATTDLNGEYRLSVPAEGGTLVFSFVGMETTEVAIGSRSVVDVTMNSDVKELAEVVVVGYGATTLEKSNISSVSIGKEAVNYRPQTNAIQALSGQVAGVNFATNTGQPGAAPNVIIRGVSTIGGNTQPLYVIDGAPVDANVFRSLNPNEIESMSVLKDASATAIYGNRGANGVIIITTKSGQFNSPLQIEVNYSHTIANLPGEDYDLLNSQDMARLQRERGTGFGNNANFFEGAAGDPLTDAQIAALPNTRWEDVFFRQANTDQFNVTISKGSENSAFSISLGYLDQAGILEKSSLERFSVRPNISFKSDNGKFTGSLNSSINYIRSEEPNSIGETGINRNPVLAAFQSLPFITPEDYVDGASLLRPLIFANTPLFIVDLFETRVREEDEIRLTGALNLSYEFIKGLKLDYQLATNYIDEDRLATEGPTSFNSLLFLPNSPGFQDQQKTTQFTYNQVTKLSYEIGFGEHTVTATLFNEIYQGYFNTYGFRAIGLDPKTFAPGDGSGFIDDNATDDFSVDQANANKLQIGLFSNFALLDYDFSSRFGFTGVIRQDFTSRFSQSKREGVFGSVAGRWNIHNEAFFDGISSVVDFLKFRASWGTNGNQRIRPGLFAAVDLDRATFRTGTGYGGLNSIFVNTLGNANLQWETKESLNFGLDFEMFGNRLRGAIEWYQNDTRDLFIASPISAINSVTTQDTNIGELRNSGWDITLNYDVLRDQNGFNLTLKFLGNYNKNEILSLPSDTIIGTGRVGGPLYDYYSVRTSGVNPENGELLFLTADGEETETPNTDTDRVFLDKNIFPDWTGSFGFDFDYKGIFLNTQWNYVVGVDRFDGDYAGFMNINNAGNFRLSGDILNAWTAENPNTDVPSWDAVNRNTPNTDRFLSSADFLRLRFITLGYNFSESILSNLPDAVKINSLRVFVSGENLVTFTKWRGFDPEAQPNNNSDFSANSRLFPTQQSVQFGVVVGF